MPGPGGRKYQNRKPTAESRRKFNPIEGTSKISNQHPADARASIYSGVPSALLNPVVGSADRGIPTYRVQLQYNPGTSEDNEIL